MKLSIGDKVCLSDAFISFLKRNELFIGDETSTVGTVIGVMERAKTIGGYGYHVLWEGFTEEIYYGEENIQPIRIRREKI